MIAYKIHAAIFDALWAVYWRVAIRLGHRDPEFPDFAWTNTRPRMQKISKWFTRHHPENQ